jgi:glycosyltransferase involved in cell wall biosynthesis
MDIFLDNIVFQLQRLGGISVYWSELLKRISNDNNDYQLIENKINSYNIFRDQLIFDNNKIILEKSPVVFNRYLPKTLHNFKDGIFHSSYYRYCDNDAIANVITVYDFMYEHFQRGIKRNIHSIHKGLAIKKADGIICISESTKRDLLSFYPSLDENKIKVIHLGVSHQFYKLEKSIASDYHNISKLISGKYILFISYRAEYKNFNMVVEALKLLPDFNLILVGGGPLTKSELIILDNKLKNRYTHLDAVKTSDLNALYNFAYCLLYPSGYEGFGLPILEAMKTGCPVICNSVSSIPEVAGNAGIMISDIDTDKIIDKIKQLENLEYREKVIQLGYKQSSKFSWDKTYNQTIDFYKEIYANKKIKAKLTESSAKEKS